MKQAASYADTRIVRTAMELSPTIDVVVVGTDVDMLILLIKRSSSDKHLYLFKPDSGKYSTVKDKKALNLVKHNPELPTLDELLLDSSSRRSDFRWRGIPVDLVWCHQHDTVLKHAQTHCFMKAVATCPIQLAHG